MGAEAEAERVCDELRKRGIPSTDNATTDRNTLLDLMAAERHLRADHYQNPEVKDQIIDYLHKDGPWLAILGGNKGWYVKDKDGKLRLRHSGDYDKCVREDRTLYWLLTVWKEDFRDKYLPKKPIGDYGDAVALRPGVDIDVDAPKKSDIEKPEYKTAVEDAARFFSGKLKDAGIVKSRSAYFSGGGIYVYVDPHLCCAPDGDVNERVIYFKTLQHKFNSFIDDVEREFFEEYPQHVGHVKYDALMNRKRQFKCPLSLHKTLDYAVVPLDVDDPIIDFEAARVPLKKVPQLKFEYDVTEKESLEALLAPYEKTARQKVLNWESFQGKESDVPRAEEPVPMEKFPPCLRKLLGGFPEGGSGKTRGLAIISTFLYQAGWAQDEAGKLCMEYANTNGIGGRRDVFEHWWADFNVPNCDTISQDGGGYPELYCGDIKLCEPEARCALCRSPLDYAKGLVIGGGSKIFFSDITKTTGTGEKEKSTFSPKKAADAVLKNCNVLTTKGDNSKDPLTVWSYDEGVYRPDGEFRIKALLDSIAGDLFTIHQTREALAKIQYRSIIDRSELDKDPYIFGIEDGVVDLRDGSFQDYDPELRITLKSPIKYNPKAKCPEIVRFLATSLADYRDILTVIDMFVAMSVRVPFDSFVVMLGEGSNGKKVFEDFISAFFGRSQITALLIDKLGTNQFGVGELRRKRAVINSDLGRSDKKGSPRETDWIKRIASGDLLDSDVKFQGHISFHPYCLQIFDSNRAPQFYDDSHGFKRRFKTLDFPFIFTDNPDPEKNERKRDPDLFKKITTEEELSGFLNLVIARAPDIIRERRIWSRMSIDETMERYDKQSRSMEAFIQDCCALTDFSEDSKILRSEYEKYCHELNVTPENTTRWGVYVTKVTGVQSHTTNGVRLRDGIRWTGGDAPAEIDSKNRKNKVSTGLEQDNRYQEQVEQVYSTIIEKVIEESRYAASCAHSVEITSSEELGKKPVLPVLPVLASGFFGATCSNPVLPVLDSGFFDQEPPEPLTEDEGDLREARSRAGFYDFVEEQSNVSGESDPKKPGNKAEHVDIPRTHPPIGEQDGVDSTDDLKEPDRPKADSVDDDMILGLTLGTWVDMSRESNGLNVRTIVTERGHKWTQKAAQVLKTLKDDHGWVTGKNGKLYPPPKEEVV